MADQEAEFAAHANSSVGDLLDYGAPGLRYWSDFLPLYIEAFGAVPGGYRVAQLEALYDQQRGMTLERLDAARQELRAALAEADAQLDAQRGHLQRLPSVWSGGAAAETAQRLLFDQVRCASGDIDIAHAAAAALEAMMAAARRAVFEKAYLTLGLLEPGQRVTIGGKSAADIRTIVAVAKAGQWIGGDQVRALKTVFPEGNLTATTTVAGGAQVDRIDDRNDIGSGTGKLCHDACTDWLSRTFKPDVEHKLETWVSGCQGTDTTIEQLYGKIAAAMNEVHESDYPIPGAVSRQRGPAQPSSPVTPGVSISSPPMAAELPRTPPPQTSALSDALAAPSHSPPPLGGLDRILTQGGTALSGLIQQGSSALQQGAGLIQQGTGGALHDVAAPHEAVPQGDSPAPEDRQATAEFDLAGRHVKLEVDPNHELTVDLSEGDESKTYTATLDEHGDPIISTTVHRSPGITPPDPTTDPAIPEHVHPIGPSRSDPKSDAPKDNPPTTPPPDDSSGAQLPTVGPLPRSENRSEGMEHRNRITPPTDRDQPGTGAQLPEAGPFP
ncbi:DNA-binding protein [Nocardia terpenica]|uniref:Uncharacterized protein n=1 Tax=Nocardia terpenica TaxID=455432 RepID=A0A291RFC8_9NOCA|nr:DNA-binding protein [Nocardia terpenica]ATL65812.1 hypothetical protein CRH09_05850 [Nocardia terpenica]